MPATEAKVSVAPFGVEIDHPRNSDVLLQSIPGQRLRSAIDGSKPITDNRTGEEMVPADQAATLGSFPKTPGQQIHVSPAKRTYSIVDPLRDDEQTLERVRRYINRRTGLRTADKINGLETIKGELDEDRLKTLCRELYNLVKSGEAKVVRGQLPSMEDIAALPGEFLLNPGSRVHTSQPRYEKDFDSWVRRLDNTGA